MSELIVSPAPHIKDREYAFSQMRDVLIALLPALFASICFFGIKGIIVTLTSIVSSFIFEVVILKIRGKKITETDTSSAIVTGLLLAFCVSSAMPWWIMIIGSFISIAIAKHAFGGLGFNIFNPALVGRAFLLTSWPLIMTTWFKPFETVTSATPLALLKENKVITDYLTMLWGNHAGSLGETSAIALILGGIYLLLRKTIDYRIPFSYLAAVAIMAALLRMDVTFNLLAGGLLLSAFFMATDPVTSPVTKPGRWIFGAGCGILTIIIRKYGGFPEGACYAILIMNAITPLLDKYFQGRIFGHKGWNV